MNYHKLQIITTRTLQIPDHMTYISQVVVEIQV